MPNKRWDDEHHGNRFPLGRRLNWFSFSPAEDETAAAIFKAHGGAGAPGDDPEPTPHFLPLMKLLRELRSLKTTPASTAPGASAFDWLDG